MHFMYLVPPFDSVKDFSIFTQAQILTKDNIYITFKSFSRRSYPEISKHKWNVMLFTHYSFKVELE
jgi:hypothetical protein